MKVMQHQILWLLTVVTAVSRLSAAQWYAAPNASTGGDGSVGNPWPLPVALTNTLIQPGDTLNLRGGNYIGPGFVSTLSGTSNNLVTIQSYPGEWAVFTDGDYGILATNLNATVTTDTNDPAGIAGLPITYANGKSLIGQILKIDNEFFWIYSKSFTISGAYHAYRAASLTVAATHTNGTPAYLTGPILTQNGTNVVFRDFEVVPTVFTNRIVGVDPDGTNYGNTMPFGINMFGYGNKAVDLIIHNTAQPGIGFWGQGPQGEVNGCLFWGCGMYDDNGTWIRGSGVYAQGDDGLCKDNIGFANFSGVCKWYCSGDSMGSGNSVNHETTTGTMSYNNNHGTDTGGPQIMAAGSLTYSNSVMTSNYMYMEWPMLGYVSPSNQNYTVSGNVIIGGGLATVGILSGFVTNNVVFMTTNGLGNRFDSGSYCYITNDPAMIRDYNVYYGQTGCQPSFELDFLTRTWPSFSQWQINSGFDLHSTCTNQWPTNYFDLVVRRLDYDTNRFHICVISTTGQTNAPLALNTCGFSAGDGYELRDAQNYFTVIASNIYTSGSINLPLNLTNVAPVTGIITNLVNQHSNVQNPGLFNVFLLHRIPPVLSPPNGLQVRP